MKLGCFIISTFISKINIFMLELTSTIFFNYRNNEQLLSGMKGEFAYEKNNC